MPVLYSHQGVPSPYAPLSRFLSSYYLLSSSSSWLCGTLVFLALLGLGIRKARSRAISSMSSLPPQQNAKSQPQSPSPPLTQLQLSNNLQPSYSEKEQFSSSSAFSSSPVVTREDQYSFWTAELPAPTLSPVEAGEYRENDPEFPKWDMSRKPREMGRTTSLPLPAPRRRSYNKSLTLDGSMGMEVSGEIIMAAEGWRRHTRVYGGGVCQACLESEQKQGEMLGQATKT